ncbi:MAG: SDR family oxidoreductase [Armatimonadetes bacterium]|nr:SDR family oxidoreductase [Armatimonadota bacterium]
MRVLVTGGAGFIGSNIVEALVARGDEVVVLDNLSTGKIENLSQVRDRIEFIEGDIRYLDTVREAVRGIDFITHQAALGSVPRSIADPRTSNDVNITGTLNVLIAAKDAGVKRVVFASSSSVYGDTVELPKHEGIKPNPRSPYALTKLAGEEYCRIFHQVYGLETVALRYFNVFGPRQDPNSQYAAVIPLFISAALRNESPTIHGDGTQSRDFTYVANVVHGNLLAFEADSKAVGRVCNLALGGQVILLDLYNAIKKLTGSTADPTFTPPRAGDVKHSCAAIELAQDLLGFAPVVSFEEGLEKAVRSYSAAVARR